MKFANKNFKKLFLIILFIILFFISQVAAIYLPSDVAEKLNKKRQIANEQMIISNVTSWAMSDVWVFNYNGSKKTILKCGIPVKITQIDNNLFLINDNGNTSYINSIDNFMINLPDVMQDEMIYDITNAYSSIYKIHNCNIDNVTNKVLYPYVLQDDGSYLVPLLYPVAKQLYEAERTSLLNGYTLKVYDAYRPYAVSKYIYSYTSDFIKNNPNYGNMMIENLDGNSYNQSWFLAKSVSNHNYGVAVDITLCDLKTSMELPMQSPMHELSTRSITSLNNANSDLLKRFMVNANFSTLKSEWWHFEIKKYKCDYATFQVYK